MGIKIIPTKIRSKLFFFFFFFFWGGGGGWCTPIGGVVAVEGGGFHFCVFVS
jgi:hypothetical protein